MRSPAQLVAALLGAAGGALEAQQPSWYPPHNLIQPTVSVSVNLDPATGECLYSYAVANGPGAQQRVDEFHIQSTGRVTGSNVRDWGVKKVGVDGFVGAVNFVSGSTLLPGRVTLQFRFSRNDQQVNPATFQAVLNGTNVTSSFVTNSMGDRVAVFTPGVAPLQRRNTIQVSVQGISATTGTTGTDADKYTFSVP
jgi:hypothetical protein